MWFIGFLFHEMSFGLLSVFLPLYITGYLGGSLTDVGLMTGVASFVAVPFSLFWGYLSDKTRLYRFHILLSFSAMTVLLYLISLTNAVVLLIALYSVMAIFHVAHEAPKNVLISEYYSRPNWERSFASYEAFTEFGWLFGLLLGVIFSGYGFSGAFMLLLCSFLNFVALITSFFLVRDPLFVFERRLVSIERAVSFVHHGYSLVSKALDGVPIKEKLKTENVSAFCAGLVLFSLATSILFVPLPIFFSRNFAIPSSIVFAVFLLNSLGGLTGYLYARSQLTRMGDKALVSRVTIFRGVLCLSLISAVLWTSQLAFLLSVAVLFAMGLAYGLFLISTVSLSMELIPEGKAGIYNALIGLGGVLGCFLGPLIADKSGFLWVFVISTILFFLSFVAFRRFGSG